ncbi:MAG: TetR/AcrR family transcriptional regulator [Rhodospirillales bacterium]|nr:TetR/AcrR family transcriptional regulator [Rhodospirillales bacterium]
MTGIRDKGKARRKQQIIQAAKRLLAAGDIEALSTRKLAEEAELSVHTLYALVGAKNKILEAVMEDNHNRVLGDILAINAQHPIEQIFAVVDSTYRLIAEDGAAQKPLMRVLMTLFDKGTLNPEPWWMLAQEKGWMKDAVAEAVELRLLGREFPAPVIADMLMKIYLANLRDYLFDRASLETFRGSATFEFWFCLSNIATDRTRTDYAARAREAATHLSLGARDGSPDQDQR